MTHRRLQTSSIQQTHQQNGRSDSEPAFDVRNLSTMAELASDTVDSRWKQMVHFLTKGLGDGAKWFRYEIRDEDEFSLYVSHTLGEKWTRFLETFLMHCCHIANLQVMVHPYGSNGLKLVLAELDRD